MHLLTTSSSTTTDSGVLSSPQIIWDLYSLVELVGQVSDSPPVFLTSKKAYFPRPVPADPTSALRVGRKFATLGGHPTDVRRTAILELYSIIAVPPQAAAATRPVRYRLERLPQINAELERWRAHWKPLLDEAQRKGDPLAYTVERTLACFVSLSVNGATFSRWSLERQKEIEQGKEGRPKLTQE